MIGAMANSRKKRKTIRLIKKNKRRCIWRRKGFFKFLNENIGVLAFSKNQENKLYSARMIPLVNGLNNAELHQ